jgi:hypothetical protein
MSLPLARIPVGIIVERRKARSPWVDFLWRPVAALPGLPTAAPWAVLDGDAEVTRFYAGGATVDLHRSDVPRYTDNLSSGAPALWIVLRPTGSEPPYALLKVTADPSEGEAFTETGSDVVEPVSMPDTVRTMIAAFIAKHPVEEVFYKREQQRADPNVLARRDHLGQDAKSAATRPGATAPRATKP